MAWTDLSFSYGSLLTSTKMTQVDDNFDALAAGSSGAPKIQTAALEQTASSEAVTQDTVRDSAIGQAQLKSSVQQSNHNPGSPAHYDFSTTGGTYTLGWFLSDASGNPNAEGVNTGGYTTSIGCGVIYNAYLQCRYISASPPYNLGDGDIPLFVYLEVRPDGTIEKCDTAMDPPWYYNGPRRINPYTVMKTPAGNRYRRVRQIIAEFGSPRAARAAGLTRAQIIDRLMTDPMVDEDLTMQIKIRDAVHIPHPFTAVTPGNTVVLLNPFNAMMDRLFALFQELDPEENPCKLFSDGRFNVSNTALNLNAPPGVIVVSATLK